MATARHETSADSGEQLISVSGLITTAGSLRTVQDPPVFHDASLAEGKQFRVEQTLDRSAQAVSGNAMAVGLVPIARLRTGLQSAAAATAVRQIETLDRVWRTRLDRHTEIDRHLLQRTTRGKWSMAKAILLIVILGVSDTALNASASIAGGDPIWLSVAEFAGVAAAAVGVGWLVGHLLSRLISAHRAGEVPDDAAALGIESFYRRRGDRSLISALCLLLAGVTGLLCWGVADLRVEAQMSWVYGMFTAVVSVGAAAVTYVAEDPIGKFIDAQLAELKRIEDRLAELTGQVDRARGLEAELGTELTRLAIHAGASAEVIRLQGEFEIQFAHPEIYGHLADRDTELDRMQVSEPSELVRLMVQHAEPSSRLPFGEHPPATATEAAEGADPAAPAETSNPVVRKFGAPVGSTAQDSAPRFETMVVSPNGGTPAVPTS